MAHSILKIKHKSIKSELNKLCKIDPELRVVIDQIGYPAARKNQPGFATLAQIINAQQISTHAAAAIWGRLEKSCNGNVTPRKVLNRQNSVLSECGLSRQKILYICGLAEMIDKRQLELEKLICMDDESVIDIITSVKGMGRWSAEIYAMFSLGRADLFPAGDLALQVAVQRYAGMKLRPNEKETREYVVRWSPHRSAAAILMWKLYGATTLD